MRTAGSFSQLIVNLPLVITTVLYAAQLAIYAAQGRPWLALVFAGYALANVGLIFGAGVP